MDERVPAKKHLKGRTTNERMDQNLKAKQINEFIVSTLMGRRDGTTGDFVDKTMLENVKIIMEKNEFRETVKKLLVKKEEVKMCFEVITDEIFERENLVITWSRIITLYALAGQLALYFESANMDDNYVDNLTIFMGDCISKKITKFVENSGGWSKLCEEFTQKEASWNVVSIMKTFLRSIWGK